MQRIRPARADEADRISELALRSKAHWRYSPEQLAVFREELTLARDQVVSRHTHVLVDSGRILGFYTLLPSGRHTVELEHLFVEPDQLRRGLGRALFQHALGIARCAGFTRLTIQSDPNAAGFYRSLGARLEREIPSSIPGRSIPYFELSLGDPPRGPT